MVARVTTRSTSMVTSKVTTGGGGASGGGGGGPSYDTDAQDYFTRAEGLGGSFNLSGINATFTESYVKTAINDFVAGLKTDNVWSKLIEVYLLAGVTFDGILAKLKFATNSEITNVNFVSGDLAAVGAAQVGLKGNATTKHLDTNCLDNEMAADDRSFGFYLTETTTGTHAFMGCRATDIFEALAAPSIAFRIPNDDAAPQLGSQTTGFWHASRRGVNDVEGYKNGVSVVTDTTTAAAVASAAEWYLFATQSSNAPSLRSNARISFAFLGQGITDAESANLNTRVQALITALVGS